MSFLDNLENTLKSLENREERDPREHERREQEQAEARAAAPWAERLRKSRYTDELLGLATQAGFRRRAKMHLAWIGTTLRLELREKRMELRPTPDGVVAVFLESGEETGQQPVSLEGRPEELLRAWLGE